MGRATRHRGADGAAVEEHRYCARCWPEWSAFYRARGKEEDRRASTAWHERSREERGIAPPPPSAEDRARFDEYATRLAAEIRAGAAEREGPMPMEVRAFLAEFGTGRGTEARA